MNYQLVVLGELAAIALLFLWHNGRLETLRLAIDGQAVLKSNSSD